MGDHDSGALGPIPAGTDEFGAGSIVHFGFAPGVVGTEQLRHIPPLDREALLKQIDRNDLGGHDLALRNDLVIVLIERFGRVVRDFSLETNVGTGLKSKFFHDRDMEIDDVDPLCEGLLFLAGIEELDDTLQGIGGLAHGRDNDHEILCACKTHDLLYVSNAFSVLDGGSTELIDFHRLAMRIAV